MRNIYIHVYNLLCFLAILLVPSCSVRPDYQPLGDSAQSNKITNPDATPVSGFLLVQIIDGEDIPSFSEIAGINIDAEHLFPVIKDKPRAKLDNWYLLTFDDEVDVKWLAERISSDPRVGKVEYDVLINQITSNEVRPLEYSAPPTKATSSSPFNDPLFPQQWHYHNDGTFDIGAKPGADINVANAWKYTAGDNRVIVAVIDQGVDVNHPDLKDNIWINEAEKHGIEGVDDDKNGYIDDIHGYNFILGKGEITPGDHGTHVAGTIAAVNNNAIGGCGIAGGTGNDDGVRIMSVQISDGDNDAYSHTIWRAIIYAADNGAVLANCSFGRLANEHNSDKEYENDTNGKIELRAINYFTSNAALRNVMDGGLLVFAAGNDSAPVACYPGAYYKNISVAAIGADYLPAWYTNYGAGVNICAPGGDFTYGNNHGILSTAYEGGGDYGYRYGTSMSAPHVTGCAALALSYALNKGYNYTVEEFRNLLLTSVRDINQYQTGTKRFYNIEANQWGEMDLEAYQNNLGSGYIDAHLLLMQMDCTPCLYVRTGELASLSLDEYFGKGSESLTYESIHMSDEARLSLGIVTIPTIEDGCLKITCTKSATGRVTIKAIIGGTSLGGGDNIGGMLVEREFEVVSRDSVAENGGWL